MSLHPDERGEGFRAVSGALYEERDEDIGDLPPMTDQELDEAYSFYKAEEERRIRDAGRPRIHRHACGHECGAFACILSAELHPVCIRCQVARWTA